MAYKDNSSGDNDRVENNEVNNGVREENLGNEEVQALQGETAVVLNEESKSHIREEKMISTSSNSITSNNDKMYSLILGSFKVEDNAHNYRNYLASKQQNVSIFNWGGSFHFVGFERIEGKKEALKLLAVMREEEEPTAWISRTRQY